MEVNGLVAVCQEQKRGICQLKYAQCIYAYW